MKAKHWLDWNLKMGNHCHWAASVTFKPTSLFLPWNVHSDGALVTMKNASLLQVHLEDVENPNSTQEFHSPVVTHLDHRHVGPVWKKHKRQENTTCESSFNIVEPWREQAGGMYWLLGKCRLLEESSILHYTI